MSESTHAPEGEETSRTLWPSLLGFALLILVFAAIVAVFYLPNQAPPVDAARDAERLAIRQDVEAKGRAEATTYAWVNRDAGVVRIPVDRAVVLTAEALAADPMRPLFAPAPCSRARRLRMNPIVYLIVLLIISLVFFAIAIAAFSWSVRSGQMKSLDEGARVVFDDDEPEGRHADAFPKSRSRRPS